MKFTGNPSLDLELDYHSSSEMIKDGKPVTRYVLSSPVSSEKEAEISKFENIKLVRNGCQHRYAPEIKYDVLYVSEPVEPIEPENNPTAKYLKAEEDLSETEIMGQLDKEIMQPEEEAARELSLYAATSSAMSSVNDLILVYKSLAQTFPENKLLFDDLVKDSEVQLGKLSSLISTQETSDNMALGLAEGEVLSK